MTWADHGSSDALVSTAHSRGLFADADWVTMKSAVVVTTGAKPAWRQPVRVPRLSSRGYRDLGQG